MKKRFTSIILICGLVLNTLSFTMAQTGRGVGVRVKNDETGKTEEVQLYKASYALIIGVSDYTNGWQSLPGVKVDVQAVSAVLKEQGFQVTTVLNPKRAELSAAIEKFIADFGYDYQNRLLIYYAGHGNTLKSGAGYEQGFIVPSDAPLLKADNQSDFRRLAISMDTIERYAQEINAKHALFVFDSCFSGSLITKTRSPVPPIITYKATQPVRQFITAGTDEQEVPDVSEFRKQFVEGLKGEADRNDDGFITASELADFLQDKVTRYTRGSQTPQYGKIRDARLDKGDFVFVAPKKAEVVNSTPTVTNNNPPTTVTADPNASEREAWNQIKDSTNRTDYSLFIEAFPNGIYAGQARAKWEEVWWDSIKNSNRKSDFEDFLKQFPSGQYASAAKFAIRRIETAATTPNTTPTNTATNSNNTNKAGAVRKNSMGMELVYIPAGEFIMGSSEAEVDEALRNCGSSCKREWFTETPKHRVTIKEGFYMGRYEVTQAQYQQVMGVNPSSFKNCDSCPVEKVSWNAAKEFIRKLNAKNDGFEYRLPTEAEWEYACRAGTTTAFSFGNTLSTSQANFKENYPYGGGSKGEYKEKTTPVGSYQPNAFGLYDMHGNVWEWVEDIYAESYSNLPTDGSANVSIGDSSKRMLRGGGWSRHGWALRSAGRGTSGADDRLNVIGFRVVAVPRT